MMIVIISENRQFWFRTPMFFARIDQTFFLFLSGNLPKVINEIIQVVKSKVAIFDLS